MPLKQSKDQIVELKKENEDLVAPTEENTQVLNLNIKSSFLKDPGAEDSNSSLLAKLKVWPFNLAWVQNFYLGTPEAKLSR